MENENIEIKTPVKVGEWFWTLLIASIPLVGLIMLFVWAFSKAENPSKASWAQAMLLWMLIGFVLAVLGMLLFFSTSVSSMRAASSSI